MRQPSTNDAWATRSPGDGLCVLAGGLFSRRMMDLIDPAQQFASVAHQTVGDDALPQRVRKTMVRWSNRLAKRIEERARV